MTYVIIFFIDTKNQMENIYELIERLNINMSLPGIPDEELKKTSYVVIRHGYSEYNYKDQLITD